MLTPQHDAYNSDLQFDSHIISGQEWSYYGLAVCIFAAICVILAICAIRFIRDWIHDEDTEQKYL